MIEQDPMVKMVELNGSFLDMGRAHGEHCRNEIQYLLAERLGILFKEAPSLRKSQLENICRCIWAYIGGRYYNLAEELGAIARAAQVKPWELVVAGAYTDLLDIVRESALATRDECTLAVNTSLRYIAGTWDSHKSAVNALVLLKRHPDIGPATLALTTAGWPAQQGINSKGLAFAVTNLTPRRVHVPGLPYIAAVAALAQLKTPADFIAVAKSERFCSGHSYVFMGRSGPAEILETTGADIDITTVTSLGTKANHYRDGSPIDDNGAYGNLANSCKRESEMRTILKGVDSPESFSNALSRSTSINRGGEHEAAVTCAYFYLRPTRQELWYQRGPAQDGKMSVATL